MDFSASQRIVIKVGSALLVDQQKGKIKSSWMNTLCMDIASLRARGKDVLVVSSGAIALGRRVLDMPAGPLSIEHAQAAAMVGQPSLISAWKQCMEVHGAQVGQGLLTKTSIEGVQSSQHAQDALNTLLALKCVPIINENDATATAEIAYGDNDQLAAYVARLVRADTLILLSDVDGLYTANPAIDKNARHIADVFNITSDIEAMAGEALSGTSRGGMRTKVMAAQIATQAGCDMIVAKGTRPYPVCAIEQGGQCTRFHANNRAKLALRS